MDNLATLIRKERELIEELEATHAPEKVSAESQMRVGPTFHFSLPRRGSGPK